MIKHIFLIVCIFVLGAAGGIWAQAFLVPFLGWNARTVVVQPVSRISVDQNVALEKTVEQVSKMVVSVESEAGIKGSGLVVTSDGLILTRVSLVPAGFGVSVLLDQSQEVVPAQVLKRDSVNNFALLKIAKNNLPTAGFVLDEEVKPGTVLVLVAATVVNEGMVRSVRKELIQTTMTETVAAIGAPLFTLEGRVAGIAAISQGGSVSVIPVSSLRDFLGL